jgi:hypothetical protein
MWTTIAYKNAFEEGTPVRIYDDSTEKNFELQQDAAEYASYLYSKLSSLGSYSVDTYETIPYKSGELSISSLKTQDALNKLTDEDKNLLGLQ